MKLSRIKQIPIRSYMKAIGCNLKKDLGSYGLYCSPMRKESVPSLKVSFKENIWVDFGENNNGGSIIDLVMNIKACTFIQAVNYLKKEYFEKESFSFHCKPITEEKLGNAIEIKKIKNLENIALLQYIQSRKIDIGIAQQYCKECYYSVANRNYFAIVFENDSESAYELRSKFFKGCIGSKNITTMSNGSDTLQIFEGFMDMLSFATHYGNEAMLSLDTIVLNSVTNIRKVKGKLANYKKIHLYLDNDNAGRNLAEKLFREFSQVIDCSHLYKNHEDFNDYLISESEK